MDVPLVPVILGKLLGNAMENNMRRAIMIDNGDWLTLIDSPLSIALWSIAALGFIAPLFFRRKVRSQMQARRDEEGATQD